MPITFIRQIPDVLTFCCRSYTKTKSYTETAVNYVDAGNFSQYLPSLAPMEEMLVARVNLLLVMYKIQSSQTSYSGHIINFPQDVIEVARRLPRISADLALNL